MGGQLAFERWCDTPFRPKCMLALALTVDAEVKAKEQTDTVVHCTELKSENEQSSDKKLGTKCPCHQVSRATKCLVQLGVQGHQATRAIKYHVPVAPVFCATKCPVRTYIILPTSRQI